jgi:thioredoxin 2
MAPNLLGARLGMILVGHRRVNYRFFEALCRLIMKPDESRFDMCPKLYALGAVLRNMKEKVHVVCGHCDSVVRLPSDRLGDAPRCPHCHFGLFEGKPVALTASNFDKHLNRSDLPVVVDFWAPWCGPCRTMAPFFEAAAKQFEPKLRFAKVNTDDETAPAERHHIKSIPTLIVFRGGQEIKRESGAMSSGALTRWLNAAIG